MWPGSPRLELNAGIALASLPMGRRGGLEAAPTLLCNEHLLGSQGQVHSHRFTLRFRQTNMKAPNEKVVTAVRKQFNRLGRKVDATRAPAVFDVLDEDSRLFALRLLSRMFNPRILDIGCGTGVTLRNLCRGQSRRRIIGIDLSESMLAAAGAVCKMHTVALVQGDGHYLPFASGSFDACNCSFCFANVGDPLRVIREMTRVLRPGGLMIFTDVVAIGLREYRQVNRLERARAPEYTRILELSTLGRLFSALPLRWHSCVLTQRIVDFERWITASDIEPGTSAFRHAKSAFRKAVLHQGTNTLQPDEGYRYSVAQFLLVRSA
jgi:ubiquinone/menaquinone biosynthesis C-methylase UbiE